MPKYRCFAALALAFALFACTAPEVRTATSSRAMINAQWRKMLPGGAELRSVWDLRALGYHPASKSFVTVSNDAYYFTWEPAGSLGWVGHMNFTGSEYGGLARDPHGDLVHFEGKQCDPISGCYEANDTFTYDQTGWHLRSRTSSVPPSRIRYAMTSTPGGALLFGGDNGIDGAATTYFDDFYRWDGDAWSKIPRNQNPKARSEAAMAYDAVDDIVLLYGGQDATEEFAETWSWSQGHWSKVGTSTSPHPDARSRAAMAYNAAAEKIFLFGGSTGTTLYNDVWSFDKTEGWSKVQVAPGPDGKQPDPQAGAQMAYDSDRQVLFLLDGVDNDSWEINVTGTTPDTISLVGPMAGDVGADLVLTASVSGMRLPVANAVVTFDRDGVAQMGSATTDEHGKATFTGSCGTSAGNQMWTAHVDSLSDTITVRCDAGEATSLLLSTAMDRATSGEGVQVMLGMRDQYGNPTTRIVEDLYFHVRDMNRIEGHGDQVPAGPLPKLADSNWTFTFGDPGMRTVAVETDPQRLHAEFPLKIKPPNKAPTISIHQIEPEERLLADDDTVTVDEGAKIQIGITVQDDGEIDARLVPQIPEPIASDGNFKNGTLLWTPERGDAESYDIKLTAIDDDNVPTTASFKIDVRGSYYGCTHTGRSDSSAFWLLLPGVLLLARRRRAALALLLISIASSARAQDDEEFRESRARIEIKADTFVHRTVAFLGLSATSSLSADIVESVSEYVATQLVAADVYQVIAKKDVQAIVSYQSEKQLLGANVDPNFLANLGQKLGASRVIRGDVSRVGTEMILNLSMVDVGEMRVLARSAQRATGEGAETLLDLVRPAIVELVKSDPDPAVAQRAIALHAGGWDASTRFYANVTLRGDADVYGGGIGFGARVAVGGEWFGGALALIMARPSKPRPLGVRLEGRVHPLHFGRFVPYLGVGATAFLPEVGVRGVLGAGLNLGWLLLEADYAIEYFPNPATIRRPTAMVISLGAGFSI